MTDLALPVLVPSFMVIGIAVDIELREYSRPVPQPERESHSE
jgi:hypothetical protein